MENKALSEIEKKSILFSCLIGAFLTPFVLSSVNIALPEMAISLNLTPSDMSDISTYFLTTSFSFLLPAAKIADEYGRLKTLKYGFILFGIFSLFCAAASKKEILLVFRAAQGASSSLIFANVMSVISSAFKKGERGKAMGITSSAIYLGLTVGPFLGGLMLKFFSWRIIFIISAILSFISVLSYSFFVKIEFKSQTKPLDMSKILTYVLLMFLISLSFLKASKYLFILIFLLPALFLFLKKDIAGQDLFNLKPLINSPGYLYAIISALFHYSGSFSLTFIFSLYFQYYLGLSPQKAGIILFFMPLFMMLLSPVAGKMSDYTNAGKMASAGIALSLFSMVLLVLISNPGPISSAILLSLIGIGFAFFSSPNTNSALSSISFRDYSSGSAVLSSARILGQNISMFFSSLSISFFLGDCKIMENLSGFIKSFKIILLFGCIMLLISAFFSLKRIKNE